MMMTLGGYKAVVAGLRHLSCHPCGWYIGDCQDTHRKKNSDRAVEHTPYVYSKWNPGGARLSIL